MQLFPLTSNMQQHLRRLVDDHYRIGAIASIEGIAAGCCNLNFLIKSRQSGKPYSTILRRYHPDRTLEQILFEHSFLEHLRQNQFALAPAVIRSIGGKTWVRATEPKDRRSYYWAIFEYLPGEDRYTWTENNLTRTELKSAAEVLAHLHEAATGFQPDSVHVASQPSSKDFLEQLYREVAGETGPFQNLDIQELMQSHKRQILAVIKHSKTADKTLSTLSKMAIHSDYHPGNLTFGRKRVAGVIDFDWSQMGYRVFDLSLALIYFAGRWEQKGQRGLDPDKFVLFLRTYNESLSSKTHASPLSAIEVELLPRLLAAANLFVLKWELDEYVGNPLKHQEFNSYINHNVGLMNWMMKNPGKMEKMIATACISQAG